MEKSLEIRNPSEQFALSSPHVVDLQKSPSSTASTSRQLYSHTLTWQQISPRVVGRPTQPPQINTPVQCVQIQQPPTSACRLEPYVGRKNGPSSSNMELSACRQSLDLEMSCNTEKTARGTTISSEGNIRSNYSKQNNTQTLDNTSTKYSPKRGEGLEWAKRILASCMPPQRPSPYCKEEVHQAYRAAVKRVIGILAIEPKIWKALSRMPHCLHYRGHILRPPITPYPPRNIEDDCLQMSLPSYKRSFPERPSPLRQSWVPISSSNHIAQSPIRTLAEDTSQLLPNRKRKREEDSESSMKLPAELLAAIADNVTGTSDLLSLGLTCKYLATTIFRFNLFYHTISGPLEQSSLWVYLIMNPRISRYIRRLQITKEEIANPKMRLRLPVDVGVNHPYKKPDNVVLLLWSYELFARALRQMVNLKAFEWSYNKTPIFANSGMGKEFSNLRILERVIQPQVPLNLSNASCDYISLFDTPVDPLDCGRSVVNFLTTCLRLKYLNLRINRQDFAHDLISLCRWPKLKVLLLSITRDYSERPTEELIEDFIRFHSDIISLKWHILFNNFIPLAILSLHPNSLPHLQALDGDDDSVRSIITNSCISPRPLKKIIGFPADRISWNQPEPTFQGVCKSSLRIVTIPVTSLAQLTSFAALFPNVECLNIMGSNMTKSASWPLSIFPLEGMNPTRDILTLFKKLRVVLGVRFQSYLCEPTLKIEGKDYTLFQMLFPHLEFCGVEDEDGIVITYRGSTHIEYDWFEVPLVPDRFLGRERDFTIREEYDRFTL
ncbi:hypothetical protein Clacol_005013 [Clathrus columnatus]|uniref:F-box domain-containing protein n=1 Tax=Clathrus columnatus TaxID=1419009 RepID=A0AAV5A8Z0_9AGAM|nr:hypothetical protein Clacol_005013 [Clathrus columnatus]